MGEYPPRDDGDILKFFITTITEGTKEGGVPLVKTFAAVHYSRLGWLTITFQTEDLFGTFMDHASMMPFYSGWQLADDPD